VDTLTDNTIAVRVRIFGWDYPYVWGDFFGHYFEYFYALVFYYYYYYLYGVMGRLFCFFFFAYMYG
jgi:hypothetical protein